MKRTDTNILVGLVLSGAGFLFLLVNLGLLGPAAAAVWAGAFVAGGVIFLAVFWRDRVRWWALIPGFVLLSIGMLIGLDEFVPSFDETWGGALVLGGISLSFWMIYLTDHARWWAVIPGGVLLSVAAIVIVSQQLPGQDLGWVIFLGIALTFGLVYLLPTGAGRNRWAIYPAAVMLGMSLLLLTTMGHVLNILWPVALILAGLYMAYRWLRLLPS
jgi:hypothetical protein